MRAAAGGELLDAGHELAPPAPCAERGVVHAFAWRPERPRCVAAALDFGGGRSGEAVVVCLGVRCYLWWVVELDGSGRRRSLTSSDCDDLERAKEHCVAAAGRRVRQVGPFLAKTEPACVGLAPVAKLR